VRLWRPILFLFLLIVAWVGLFETNWRPVVAEVRFRTQVHRVESYAEAIRFAAVESDQDPNLLAAIMYVESGGDLAAVSEVDALGLYQLMLPTAKERARLLGLPEPGREELLADPLLNARLGASYLKWLTMYCGGDLDRMLVAYNAGPGRLNKWIDEAGSWEAWRAEREAAGNSQVLGYARRVKQYRDRFAERGVILPPGLELEPRERIESGFVRPPADESGS
jgi:soluble lytic murein transglycosylase